MEYRNVTFQILDDNMKPTGRTKVHILPVYQEAAEARRAKPASKPIPTRSIIKWEPKPFTAREQEVIERYCAKVAFRKQCERHWLELIRAGF